MELDLQGEHASKAYTVLSGLVVPRPIALVTTVDREGRANAAPFSFFNVFGSRPPMVAFAPGDRAPGVPKDTARNLRANGEFVVHLVDEGLTEKMNLCATSLAPGESELELAGLTAVPSVGVRPPRIAEAPVAMECREHSTVEIGRNRLVIGVVGRIWVRDGLLAPDSLYVDREAYRPVGRMQTPHWYCRTGDVFSMENPG